MTDRYGARRVPKMLAEWREHAALCRAEGTPAIQDSIDKVQQCIDFAFGQNAERKE